MLFYCAMREKLVDLGEEFDQNYHHVVIRDMLGKIREIIIDVDSMNLKVYVGVTTVVDRTIKDELSILQPVNRMKVDDRNGKRVVVHTLLAYVPWRLHFG
ncbi:hypothetical protein R3W88_015771 [Solanum pinnatisectum]|uniref:Uncharacterized protein n=1 Tax=Solanum pinnatisectum TaxID=50273 RepID=A0AAV9KWQ7_9SOLN|nr:hypothetical protein R3W88_015771 [Solanum pinnatisectum]